uniref:non-specific serine/threonine protein kinase n=1 Tax=Ananas comosus var. bracteatus TaxID=296719 RepID=A0A6V7P506_ANACO|nr:unnamed protein product [Ananas comosus var. bracteatus]
MRQLQLRSRSLKRCFSYEEIRTATNGFHQDNLVGRGGYAEVYRGVMQNGEVIAVKRLTQAATDEQKEKDFLTELGTIGHVRHPNVSCLLGCCVDRELYLIFEFSSRGSVSSNLHDENLAPMAWKLRFEIAVGTARGLQYLHKGCQRRIIHRDIKTSNVLLTSNFVPQISDFGLARWLPKEWTHRAVAPIEGTFGCLAPEYFTHGIVDEKPTCSRSECFSWNSYQEETMMACGSIGGSAARRRRQLRRRAAEALTFVAALCIRASATWRPSMTEVLELLEDGEISQERWKMPEEEEDEFWGFDDLDDDHEFDTPLHLHHL